MSKAPAARTPRACAHRAARPHRAHLHLGRAASPLPFARRPLGAAFGDFGLRLFGAEPHDVCPRFRHCQKEKMFRLPRISTCGKTRLKPTCPHHADPSGWPRRRRSASWSEWPAGAPAGCAPRMAWGACRCCAGPRSAAGPCPARTVPRRAAGARRACARPRGPWESAPAGWEARSAQASPRESPMRRPSPRAEAAPEEMEMPLRSLATRPPHGQLWAVSKYPNTGPVDAGGGQVCPPPRRSKKETKTQPTSLRWGISGDNTAWGS